MAQPAPAPAGARPLGKPRGWVVVVLLSLVTLGIYFLVYQYKTFQEMKDYSGEGIGGVVALILAIFLGIVNWFLMPAEVGNLYAAEGQEKPVSGIYGLWNLLPLVGTFIWLAKTQNALSAFWEAHGAVRP
jgi:protein-S-isoprenylcysteine O-methyltransferase Ste14